MNSVEVLFLHKAVKRSGVYTYSKEDALLFIDECERQNIGVLGLDGFYIAEKTTQPSLENTVDFSAFHLKHLYERNDYKNTYAEARRFVEQADDKLRFEIVCSE